MRPPVVLVFRAEDSFSACLRESGCEVLNLELIKTRPIDDLTLLHEKLDQIDKYDGLFFTSPVAARIFIGERLATGHHFSSKIYVLGERTRNCFKNTQNNVVFRSSANTAEEMLASFDEGEFSGKSFLFVCGDKSLRAIPRLLDGRATVEEVVVYKTLATEPDSDTKAAITERLRKGEIDWLCFFSPSGVDSFAKFFDPGDMVAVKTAAIGHTTAKKAQEAGLRVEFISERASGEDFAAGLIKHIKHIE